MSVHLAQAETHDIISTMCYTDPPIFYCPKQFENKRNVIYGGLSPTYLFCRFSVASFFLFTFRYNTLLSLVPISMYNGQRGILNYILTSIIRYVIIMVIIHPAQSISCFNETAV